MFRHRLRQPSLPLRRGAYRPGKDLPRPGECHQAQRHFLRAHPLRTHAGRIDAVKGLEILPESSRAFFLAAEVICPPEHKYPPKTRRLPGELDVRVAPLRQLPLPPLVLSPVNQVPGQGELQFDRFRSKQPHLPSSDLLRLPQQLPPALLPYYRPQLFLCWETEQWTQLHHRCGQLPAQLRRPGQAPVMPACQPQPVEGIQPHLLDSQLAYSFEKENESVHGGFGTEKLVEFTARCCRGP